MKIKDDFVFFENEIKTFYYFQFESNKFITFRKISRTYKRKKHLVFLRWSLEILSNFPSTVHLRQFRKIRWFVIAFIIWLHGNATNPSRLKITINGLLSWIYNVLTVVDIHTLCLIVHILAFLCNGNYELLLVIWDLWKHFCWTLKWFQYCSKCQQWQLNEPSTSSIIWAKVIAAKRSTKVRFIAFSTFPWIFLWRLLVTSA